MEVLQLEPRNENLEAAWHQLEIDEFLAAGLGEHEHLMAIQATVDRHDEVRAGVTDDLTQGIVGTQHRDVGRRLSIKLGGGRHDHAVDADPLGATCAEALNRPAAFLVPADKNRLLAECFCKRITAQHAVEKPAPAAEHRHRGKAGERAVGPRDGRGELEDQRDTEEGHQPQRAGLDDDAEGPADREVVAGIVDAEIRKQHEHQGTTEDHVTKVSPEIDLRIIHADVLEFRFNPISEVR